MKFCIGLLLVGLMGGNLGAQLTQPSSYRGWDTLKLANGLVELQVAPDIGGRVIQLTLNQFEYLFVNDQLAGNRPSHSGVGPDGQWLNYGGEKLWPAPQGKGSPDKWDGPPDPILDGSPHAGTIVRANGNPAAVRLVSRDDPRSGIRFSREIQLFADSSRVHIEATMTNVDTKPRRWGIWSVLQHNAANRSGTGHDQNIRVYCPLRPNSVFPKGYCVMRGPADPTSFHADTTRRMIVAHYERKMGKIGVDCAAGWVATVHGSAGYVLVQRFPYYPDREYPDQASVEIWLHGPYGPKASMTDPTTFPYFIESELLSPFAQLAPGESYTFGYDWFAAAIGGNYPVLGCTDAGVICEPLTATVEKDRLAIKGRFGVFCRGTARLVFQDAEGNALGQAALQWSVSPVRPLVFAESLAGLPQDARTACLMVYDASGRNRGSLATVEIPNGQSE
jgi:hypothetical protein